MVLAPCRCTFLLSLVITPILRARLHEKFNRGAENQAFLVETVYRHRDGQGHGGRAADGAPLGRAARRLRGRQLPHRQLWPRWRRRRHLIGKLVTVAILWIGAQLVMKASSASAS